MLYGRVRGGGRPPAIITKCSLSVLWPLDTWFIRSYNFFLAISRLGSNRLSWEFACTLVPIRLKFWLILGLIGLNFEVSWLIVDSHFFNSFANINYLFCHINNPIYYLYLACLLHYLYQNWLNYNKNKYSLLWTQLIYIL